MVLRIRNPLYLLQRYRQKSGSGQSLIEVLVSVALLSIVIGSVIAIMPGVLSTSAQERDQTLAYQYAREGIEQIRHVRDSNAGGINSLLSGTYCLNSDGSTSSSCSGSNIGIFKRDLAVSPNDAQCGGKITKVTVTVSWRSAKCTSGASCNQSIISTCLNPNYNYLATYVTPTPTLTPTPTPIPPTNTPTPTPRPTSTPTPTLTPTPRPTNTPTPTPKPIVTYNFPVAKDTYIWQQNGGNGYCTAGAVKVINENAVDTKWGILSFNLTSFIPPAGKTLIRADLTSSVTNGSSNSSCEQHLHKWSNWGSNCPTWNSDTGNSGVIVSVIPGPATGQTARWVMTPTDAYAGAGINYINNNIGTNLQYGIRTDQTSGCSNETDYGSKTSTLILYYQ